MSNWASAKEKKVWQPDERSSRSSRSMMRRSDDRPSVMRRSDDCPSTGSSTTAVFNYLSENFESIEENEAAMQNFEEFVERVLYDSNNQPLKNVLKTYGWNGRRFNEFLILEDCLKALANLYISQQRTSTPTLVETVTINPEISEAETVLAFVPSVLIGHVSTNSSAISLDGVSSTTFFGAAMLADISGFSKFAGTMCSRGVKGLDDLHETTNVFLAHFVQVVHQFGGDVVAFAGDALLCVFKDVEAPSCQTERPLRTERSDILVVAGPSAISSSGQKGQDVYVSVPSYVRAIQCGLVLKEHTHHDLCTHIAVSCGEMKISLLGGHNDEWSYLVNGLCISELTSCITDSQTQQLVVTEKCYMKAYEYLEKQQARGRGGGGKTPDHTREGPAANHNRASSSGFFPFSFFNNVPPTGRATAAVLPYCDRIEAQYCPTNTGNVIISSVLTQHHPTPTVNRLRKLILTTSAEVVCVAKLFVPAPVMAAMCTDSLERISELRYVTTMFLSLDSYCPETHHDPLSLQPFFRIVQETLHESGGYLRQFLVDDKGCAVIAMWGVPSYSYASNCSRALYTAVAIKHRVHLLELDCSAGIATGYGYCGTVGATERKDYVVIGNEVNLAARLMSKANGNVLVDKETYQYLSKRGKAMLETGEEVLLKSAVPIKPYVYVGAMVPSITMLDDFDDSHHIKSTILPKRVTVTLSERLDKISNLATVRMSKAKADGNNSLRSNRNHSESSVYESSMRVNSVRGGPKNLKSSWQGDNAWGKGSIFTIVLGIPGTGKSTASRFFLATAQRRNLVCYAVKCSPGEESHPFSLVRKLFYEIVGPQNFKEDFQQRSMLTSIVDRMAGGGEKGSFDQGRAYTILEYMLGLRGHTSEKPMLDSHSMKIEQGDGAIRVPEGDLTFCTALAILLRNRRSVFVIDNAHHCDELSWQQLRQIAVGKNLPVAVLITYCLAPAVKNRLNASKLVSSPSLERMRSYSESVRAGYHDEGGVAAIVQGLWSKVSSKTVTTKTPSIASSSISSRTSNRSLSEKESLQNNAALSYQNTPFSQIALYENCTVLQLTTLREMDVKAILVEEIASTQTTPELVESVLEVTSGNAFWCKTVAQYIRENGIAAYYKAIERRGDKHNTLKALILSRVDMLTSEQQIVAKHASIIGDEFELVTLVAVLPSKLQPIVAKCLIILQHAGLISCIDETENTFEFQNQLIRNTLYDLTPPSDACTVHLAVAHFLETAHRDTIVNFYPVLSYHYRHSKGKREQALKYTCKAADQVIRLGAFSRGYFFLQTALPLAVSRPELRVLLTVVSRAVKVTSTSGISGFVKKMSSFSTANDTMIHVEYCHLRDDIEKTLDDLDVKDSSTIEIDAAKMTNSSRVLFGVLEGTRSVMLSRQPSMTLNWQPSDPLPAPSVKSAMCVVS